jgi:hypothetical protein
MCGRENDFGLKMVWYNNPESNQVEATVTIGEHFNGYMTYRKPTPTNTPLKAVGWLEHKGNKGMKVAAKLLLPDGTVTTECKAVVIRPTGEISRSWEPERKFWRVEDD